MNSVAAASCHKGCRACGTSDLCAEAVYGLPELHRAELKSARYVSGVGCNATATTLAVFFVPVFFVVVRRFFKGSERQRRMYAHEADNQNLHPPQEDR